MIYILYNPLANNGNGLAGVEEVRAFCGAEACELHDITTLDAKAFLMGLPADDRVILCGGDGTINHLINDLDGALPAVPIHAWRFGTGNDFIRDVTADSDPTAKTAALSEYIQNLPRAIVGDKQIRFVNGCSGGVDSLVCAKMNEARGKKPNYVTTALKAFFNDFKKTGVRITVDGVTHEFDGVWMAGAMNGRYQGGGMKFAPDQDRTGDRLCCYVWHGTSILGTLLHFPGVISGKYIHNQKHCEIRFGREITIEFRDPQPIQFDGEVLPDVKRFTLVK